MPAIITIIVVVVLLLLSLVLYLVPSIIAVARDHHQVAPIIAINILLGWLFIGWVVAFAWSLSAKRPTK